MIEFIAIPRGVVIAIDVIKFIARIKAINEDTVHKRIMLIAYVHSTWFRKYPYIIAKSSFDVSQLFVYRLEGVRAVEHSRYFSLGQFVVLDDGIKEKWGSRHKQRNKFNWPVT